jgi:hypothetical protein
MNWLNAGALSLMLMMLVGTFHLGAILTGEVGTVSRHAANLVVVQPWIKEVELPNYNGSDSDSYKATLGDGSAGEGNQPASENHCRQLGGNYSEGNCCGPDGTYFFNRGVFSDTANGSGNESASD